MKNKMLFFTAYCKRLKIESQMNSGKRKIGFSGKSAEKISMHYILIEAFPSLDLRRLPMIYFFASHVLICIQKVIEPNNGEFLDSDVKLPSST